MLSIVLPVSVALSFVNVGLGQGLPAAENNSTSAQQCERFDNAITITAHIGWPFRLTCISGLKIMSSHIRSSKKISCTIKTSNGTVLWSSPITKWKPLYYGTHMYPEIETNDAINSTYSFEIKAADKGFCGVSEVKVIGKLSNEMNYNCGNLSSSFDSKRKHSIGVTRRSLGCRVPFNSPVPLYENDNQYTYEWWYNCTKTLPSNVTIDERDGKTLHFRVANYSNSGDYVCAVRYGNQIRFLHRYPVCAKPPSVAKLTMKCPKRVSGKEGSNLDITCYVDYGIGQLGLFNPFITWYNSTNSSDEKICVGFKHMATRVDTILDDDEVKCTNAQPTKNVFNHTNTCFQYRPPPGRDITLKAQYNVTLQIKNLRHWDVGNYTVMHYQSLKRTYRRIEVYMDTSEELINNSIKAGVGVAIIAVLILLFIICYWRRYDLLWCYKVHLGPYEIERKTHDVVLVYHYSRDDMTISSKVQTETLVEHLQLFLVKKNLTFYDENREDGDFQFQVQNISKVLDDCHRILIILNMEIAFDEWNLHKVYTAVKNSAKGGTNVIFISLPGLKSKFHNAPNQAQVALKHAMKVGTTIDWSGKVPFDSGFKRMLEYVLPKKPANPEGNRPPSPVRPLVDTAL